MKKIPSRLFLYVIFDGREKVIEKLKGIIKAGVEILQLRDKNLSTRELVDLGEKAKEVIKDRALFFINDRLDIAMAVSADGIHLGQDDLSIDMVKKFMDKKFLIGFSTHTIKEVKESFFKPIDYISFGPIFKTKTKPDALSPRGIDRLEEAVSYSKKPVVAIGGINKENIVEVLKTGVSGVAISSSILNARDTYKATLEIREILNL